MSEKKYTKDHEWVSIEMKLLQLVLAIMPMNLLAI